MTTPAPRASRLRSRALSRPLAVGFVIVTLAALIAWVGSAALAGETRWLDEALLHWARDARAGRPWLAEVMRDFSGLGSTVVLALFSLGVVAYLALFSSRRTAWLVATSVLSGWLVMQLLKRLFARLRPDSALAELVVPGMSFPSGHASMSALVFLTAGALLAATRARRRERAFVLRPLAEIAPERVPPAWLAAVQGQRIERLDSPWR